MGHSVTNGQQGQIDAHAWGNNTLVHDGTTDPGRRGPGAPVGACSGAGHRGSGRRGTCAQAEQQEPRPGGWEAQPAGFSQQHPQPALLPQPAAAGQAERNVLERRAGRHWKRKHAPNRSPHVGTIQPIEVFLAKNCVKVSHLQCNTDDDTTTQQSFNGLCHTPG